MISLEPTPKVAVASLIELWLGEHGLCAVACTCSYLRNHEAVAREQAKVWAMNEAINMFIGALAASTAEARYQAFLLLLLLQAFPAPPGLCSGRIRNACDQRGQQPRGRT